MHAQHPATLSEAANRLRELIPDSFGRTGDGPPSSHGCGNPGITQQFDSFAIQLFRLQFQENESYRKFCQARSSFPDRMAHWTQIPFLPVAAFKESACTSLPEERQSRVFHSSGTTPRAHPSRHFHSDESLGVYEASILPWFKQHLLPDHEAWRGRLFGGPLEPPDFLILTPPPAICPTSSLAHMFEVVRGEHAPSSNPFHGKVASDGSWALDLPAVASALQRAVDFLRPLTLMGTAFSFVELADHLSNGRKEMVLPSGSRVLETGGYKGRCRSMPKEELYSMITRTLGIPEGNIVSEYGMSELSSQAYDRTAAIAIDGICPEDPVQRSERVFRFPPWTRTRIVSPEDGREVLPGETGILQVFDMANIFSVAALQTEDIAVRKNEGFELLGRVPLSEPRGCSLRQLESTS